MVKSLEFLAPGNSALVILNGLKVLLRLTYAGDKELSPALRMTKTKFQDTETNLKIVFRHAFVDRTIT